MLVVGRGRKGSPRGIIGPRRPPWGDRAALFSVPSGRDIKYLLSIYWLAKKKEKERKRIFLLQSFVFGVASLALSL